MLGGFSIDFGKLKSVFAFAHIRIFGLKNFVAACKDRNAKVIDKEDLDLSAKLD